MRSAVALYRLLDVLRVFAGDDRIERQFTLVPGSDFDVDALAVLGRAGARTVPWDVARRRAYDLVLSASPKGALRLLRGDRVLFPHGAGFGKAIPGEGTACVASGLDPAYLGTGDDALALYALAHPGQVARLARTSPAAAERARVVGDPTLDRLLASRPSRDRYRRALGTGGRRLIALTSTWGPQSLLRRRPGLAAELLAHLPYDEYQVALLVHPNEWSRLSTYELRERLAPALDAGLVLAEPYEEWAAVLVAADALVCDHGSAALYFAAATHGAHRPIVSVGDGGNELVPDSPIAALLARVPRLDRPGDLPAALSACPPDAAHAAVTAAFAEQGLALRHLRRELYGLLGLDAPHLTVGARLLPVPVPRADPPGVFDVHAEVCTGGVRLTRAPAGLGPAGHHLAAEYAIAGDRRARTAAVLYLRGDESAAGPHATSWTAGAWTAHALAEYPGSRLTAAVSARGGCLIRLRDGGLHTLRTAPHARQGRLSYADPAAAASAVYAWFTAHRALPRGPVDLTLGERVHRMTLAPAAPDDHDRPV